MREIDRGNFDHLLKQPPSWLERGLVLRKVR